MAQMVYIVCFRIIKSISQLLLEVFNSHKATIVLNINDNDC